MPPLLEPAAAVTDAALTVVAFALACHTLRREPRPHYWSAAFASAGVSALLGTIYHGRLKADPTIGFPLWTIITLWVAVTVSFLLSGTVATLVGAGRARFWLWLRTVGLGAFVVVALTGHAGMGTLLLTESATMTAILVLWLRALRQGRPGAGLVVGAIGLSAVAGALRVSPLSFTLGWEFTPTALYHLVQIPGLLALAWGLAAMRAGSSGGRPRAHKTALLPVEGAGPGLSGAAGG
jgi:hypothetical protein